MAGTIQIDAERCKGCTLCAGVCPQNVIAMTNLLNGKGYHPAALIDPNGDCTGCAVCAIICPDVCITVFREAAPSRHNASVKEVQR